jgi:hypothetical protein
MAKIGRPAIGQAPVIGIRLPVGWSRQINSIARETHSTRSKVARSLIGAALAARKVKGGDGVVAIDMDVARTFVALWHYAGDVPTGKNTAFGWFIESELYAVAVYGVGVFHNQHQFLARESGLPVERGNVLELRRLCRIEPPRKDRQLSQFIAACHRILKKDHGVRFVVSFSDPARGHNGGIYRASNFKHFGQTRPETHTIAANGEMVARTLVHFRATRARQSLAEMREALGVRQQVTRPKDRWMIDLG